VEGHVAKGSYSELGVALGAGSRHANLGVDVEESLEAARRPDGALDAELVRLEVVVVVGALNGEGRADLCSVLAVCKSTADGQGAPCLLGVTREVVGGLAGTGFALADLGVAAVVGLEDGELPAGGVLKLDVELAVLALVGCLGNEAVVEQGDGGQVRRELARDGAGPAARASIGNARDLDLVAGGSSSEILARNHGLDLGREGSGQAGKEGEDVREMHVEDWKW
jgi:hypothetical protein